MKYKSLIYILAQTLLGLTFLFSGFVKGADPMGSQIKFEEYFNSFGLQSLSDFSLFFALLLILLETTLGFLILSGIYRRVVSRLVALFLVGFTLLTVVIYFLSPVEDCGCFGDAVKLTNGQTLLKNILLILLLIPYFVKNYNITEKNGRFASLQLAFFALVALVPPCYAIVKGPIIDFLPYKIGVSIPNLIKKQNEAVGDIYKTTLLYREKSSGKVVEFTLEDTTWYNDTLWEYVDTKNRLFKRGESVNFVDFDIFSPDGTTVTDYILSQDALIVYVCSDREVDEDVIDKLLPIYYMYSKRGYNFVALTQYGSSTLYSFLSHLGGITPLDIYNIDQTLIKSLIRAKHGVVILENGIIKDKIHLSFF